MSPSRTRRLHPRLKLQALEDRLAPATDNWINPNGGAWATGSNWDLGHAPSSGGAVASSRPTLMKYSVRLSA